jgi:hypothetical protein
MVGLNSCCERRWKGGSVQLPVAERVCLGDWGQLRAGGGGSTWKVCGTQGPILLAD